MEKDKPLKPLVKMPNDKYDEFMCEKFPELFQDRRKPMNQTCMCWGFNIGEGWNELLYNLCEKLETIRKTTGLVTVFDQIKEKFGGGRFYYHIDGSACKLERNIVDLWVSLIESLVSRAERESDETCAVCGERYYHDKIVLGGWVYDSCKECMINGKRIDRSDIKEILEEQEKWRDRYETIVRRIEKMDDSELCRIETCLADIDLDRKAKEPNV
jgi:hypothetical protein